MRYSFRFRLLIAVLAVLAGGAVPATAVGHGITHARDTAHETPEHHHHSPEHGTSVGSGDGFHPTDGHGHPVLDLAATKRLSADIGVRVAAHLKALPDPISTTMGLRPVGNERSTGASATGPPPSLRAPPIL